MTISEHEGQAFKELEKNGWSKQAQNYDAFAGQMTRQAVNALLGTVDARTGTELLDVATGPGYVAAEAARRGADVTAVDISKDMLAEAHRRFPDLKLEIGDAEQLRYADATFDLVVCAFGMLHFPRAGKAVAEAYRVLRPGGRYGFTVWCGPAKAKLLTLIGEAVQRHADPSTALPAGPNGFMLSDVWVSTALMEAATFTDVRTEEIPCFYEAASPADVFDMMRKSTVRSTYVYDRQTADVQRRIEQAIKEAAADVLAAGGGKIACPAMLVSGIKTSG
jgi:ubiquinone/menaquinone biosynthesis C-methylase UbiE